MNIAVVGSRTFEDYRKLEFVMDDLIRGRSLKDVTIVSGGAKGADTLAEMYARNRGYPMKVFHADWYTHGKSAGFIRNEEIASHVDLAIGFSQNDSKGTAHCLKACADKGIEVILIQVRS